MSHASGADGACKFRAPLGPRSLRNCQANQFSNVGVTASHDGRYLAAGRNDIGILQGLSFAGIQDCLVRRDARTRRGSNRNTALGSMINSDCVFAGLPKVRRTSRWWTTTEGYGEMFKNGMRPVHPGEVLREDFLKPLGMSANALAKALHVPTPRINEVVRKRRGVSADTAMRLARYFGGDARSWLNLQTAYDLRVAEISNARRIVREISPAAV
jgi:addiction module HigA family antidote